MRDRKLGGIPPKAPSTLLEGALRLARGLEGDVNTAQAYAQTDGDFVWMKMNEAKSKLKQLKSTLEALSKTL